MEIEFMFLEFSIRFCLFSPSCISFEFITNTTFTVFGIFYKKSEQTWLV